MRRNLASSQSLDEVTEEEIAAAAAARNGEFECQGHKVILVTFFLTYLLMIVFLNVQMLYLLYCG